MFLENVMLAAVGAGLATCPQFSLTEFHRICRKHLGIPDGEVMVCAMALGRPDPDAIENTLVTERAPLEDWVRFA